MKIISMALDDNHQKPKLSGFEKSITQQHLANECDINTIIKKYKQKGVVTHLNAKKAQYGDFTQYTDYQTSLNKIMAANDIFMALTPELRERFDNDPGKMLAFITDPKNVEEGIRLGLLEAKKPEGISTSETENPPLESKASTLKSGVAVGSGTAKA